MAMESERLNHFGSPRDRPSGRARAKPNGHEDFYLCVVFVALLVLALYVGLVS